MANVDTNTLSWEGTYLILYTLNLLKSYLKLISSTCSCFWLTTYLLSLVYILFSRQSVCIWVQTVLLFSPTFSFIRMRQNSYEKNLTRSFNFTFRYIDETLSLNNSRFGDFVDRIYPIELPIKDTTDTDRPASYLDLHLEIDSKGRLKTKLFRQKRWFQFSHS